MSARELAKELIKPGKWLKVVGGGRRFIVDLRLDGTLREWAEDDDGDIWGGEWSYGSVGRYFTVGGFSPGMDSASPAIRIVIGGVEATLIHVDDATLRGHEGPGLSRVTPDPISLVMKRL